MLYDDDEEKVSLEKEIEYLQSYIDLQQQRFGKNVQVNVSLEKVDDNYEIEPMLLIPFVENAFKHGTGLVTKAEGTSLVLWICRNKHKLTAEKGILKFSVQNRYNEGSSETKDKTSVLG